MAVAKVVNGLLVSADGVPHAGALVRVKLSQPVVISGTSEVETLERTATTAADGTYSLSLYSNADLTPTGTYYTVTEDARSGDAYTFTVVVPATAGPFIMSSIQTGVLPTASPAVGHLSSLTVDAAVVFTAGPVTMPAASLPESAITSLTTDLAARALDATVVHNTGAEAVAGIKTFSSAPVVPASSFPEGAVANLTADLAAKATDTTVVHLAGTESMTGDKTHSGRLITAKDFVHSTRVATETELVSGLDASLAETVVVTLTANRNIGVPINGVDGHRMKVVLIEGGVGGFTVTPNAALSITNWALNLAIGQSTELPLERVSGVWLLALNPPLAITFLTPSGGDDRNALNSALAALPATGGKILMGTGAWQIGSAGNVSYQMLTGQHVMIEGQGKVSIASTVPEPGNEYGAITLTGASDGTSEVTLRNFTVNHTNSGPGVVDGIMISYPGWPTAPTNRSVKRFTIEDIVVTGASRAGIRCMYTQNGRLVNVSSTGNRNAGAFLLGDDNLVVIGGDYSTNVTGTLTGDYGLSVDSSSTVPYATNLTYIGVKANNNGRKGFDVHHGHDITMIACTAKGNGYCGFYAVTEGLDKDTGDVTFIGCTADMTGANATLAVRAYEIGSFGTPNAAQKPGTFRMLGCKARAVDANGRTDGVSVLLRNPTSGPPANLFAINDCDFSNGGGSTAYIIETDAGAVPAAYMKISDNKMHAVTVIAAIWIQTAPSVLLEIDNNEIQVDAAGGVYNWTVLASGTPIGSISQNKITGATPANTAAVTTGTTLATRGNSLNGAALVDSAQTAPFTAGSLTVDVNGHLNHTKVGVPTTSAINADVTNVVIIRNDDGFTITFDVITLATVANANLMTIGFFANRGVRPTVNMTTSSTTSGGVVYYPVSINNTGFVLRCGSALGIAVGYSVDVTVTGYTS